jgi:hypothetical protein
MDIEDIKGDYYFTTGAKQILSHSLDENYIMPAIIGTSLLPPYTVENLLRTLALHCSFLFEADLIELVNANNLSHTPESRRSFALELSFTDIENRFRLVKEGAGDITDEQNHNIDKIAIWYMLKGRELL